MHWSFSYSGELAGLSKALDDRADASVKGGLAGDSLAAFVAARPLIESQAAQCATVADRAASQGHVVGDNLVSDHRKSPSGAAVVVHAYATSGADEGHQNSFVIDIKSFDHAQ